MANFSNFSDLPDELLVSIFNRTEQNDTADDVALQSLILSGKKMSERIIRVKSSIHLNTNTHYKKFLKEYFEAHHFCLKYPRVIDHGVSDRRLGSERVMEVSVPMSKKDKFVLSLDMFGRDVEITSLKISKKSIIEMDLVCANFVGGITLSHMKNVLPLLYADGQLFDICKGDQDGMVDIMQWIENFAIPSGCSLLMRNSQALKIVVTARELHNDPGLNYCKILSFDHYHDEVSEQSISIHDICPTRGTNHSLGLIISARNNHGGMIPYSISSINLNIYDDGRPYADITLPGSWGRRRAKHFESTNLPFELIGCLYFQLNARINFCRYDIATVTVKWQNVRPQDLPLKVDIFNVWENQMGSQYETKSLLIV